MTETERVKAEEILKPFIKNVKSGFGTYPMIDYNKSIKALYEYAIWYAEQQSRPKIVYEANRATCEGCSVPSILALRLR